MLIRKRTLSLLAAATLAASALVATAGAPVANAVLSCDTLVSSVNAENRILYRYVENDTVVKEKTSKVISGSMDALLGSYGGEIEGGYQVVNIAYRYGTKPRYLRITNLDDSPTLGVTALSSTYTHVFNANLVANSGSYYVYGVSPSTGNLVRWTRVLDQPGKYMYVNPTVVARYMSGLKTLTYAWTFKVDGVYRDFLVATTKSGALKQIQVPHVKPAAEKQVTLATSGFADVTGVSPSFCNDNPRHLSLLTVNGTQGHWYTLPSQTAPTLYPLVDRGLIAGEHDWNLHAVS